MTQPQTLDHSFTGAIGVDIKGEPWPCVEVPGSVELLGTGKAVKVVGTVDGVAVSTALLPTGSGGHMLSLNAKLRARLGKDIGDEVSVHLTERLG